MENYSYNPGDPPQNGKVSHELRHTGIQEIQQVWFREGTKSNPHEEEIISPELIKHIGVSEGRHISVLNVIKE